MTKAEVLSAFQLMIGEIDAIEEFFVNGRIPAAQTSHAQQMFKKLKNRLEAEHKRMSTIKAEDTLSDAEVNFYKPAVHEVWVEISNLRWNSRPDQEWLEKLLSACDQIGWYANNLKGA